MFQAGDVTPSSVFLLQLLTPPGGDFGIPLEVFEALEPPVKVGLRALSAGGLDNGLNVAEPPALLVLIPLLLPNPGDASDPPLGYEPVAEGLWGPAPRLGPIVVAILEGLTALATRLNALRHCSTWAGSLDS